MTEQTSGAVRLHVEGAIATITNDSPARHNAFDDAMDHQLFTALDEIAAHPSVRVIIWRGEGPSFSSGRDVGAIEHPAGDLTHHQLMQHVTDGARRFLDIDVPIIAVLHGWVMGVSFQRALLCDLRIASSSTRFRLPEIRYGFIPDSGGVARLFQMCGHGLGSDLVLTGRTMDATEALTHGIVSRVVDEDKLDVAARTVAERIVDSPALTVKLARNIISHLGTPAVDAAMREELLAQTVIATSHDYREMRRARREQRPPAYRRT